MQVGQNKCTADGGENKVHLSLESFRGTLQPNGEVIDL